MKKRILHLFLAIAGVSVMATSCATLQSVLSQAAQLANLANCQYTLKNVTDVTVAGVSIRNVTNGNISATDILKLTTAITSKNVPLAMNVNVNVNNPTAQAAALTAMDWIMEIDGTQFATGTSTNAYAINPNGNTVIPLNVNTDVYSLFSNINSLKNFVTSFSSDGTSSKIGLKIKPSINVGGVQVPMPNFITLEKTTGNTSSTSTTTTTTNSNNNNSNNNGGQAPTSGFKPLKQ